MGESTSAAVLDGTDIVYVARVATTHRLMNVGITVGTRFPAYATSMGRVLLAARGDDGLAGTDLRSFTEHTAVDVTELRTRLAEVRRQGWARVDEELAVGLRAIAVPVRDASRTVVAALNVSMAATAGPDADPDSHLDALRETAAAIEADLALLGR